jgi:hypothetical protein
MVADELKASAIATIDVGDLSASHHIVAVTRRGGFLSAASRHLLDNIRAHYSADKIATVRRARRQAAKRQVAPRRARGKGG